MSTTKPQEEDWDQNLALPAPTVEWGHLMNQLNQDPREDSVADSDQGTAAMDLEDPYFEFTDENSIMIQTPVAALTPMSMPTEGTLTGLEQLSLKEPQVENPELVSISKLVPYYSDVPLVGFS